MVNLNTSWVKVTKLSGPRQLEELIIYSVQQHTSLSLAFSNEVRINRVNHYCVMTKLEIEECVAKLSVLPNVNESGYDLAIRALVILDGKGNVDLKVKYQTREAVAK